MKKNSITGHDAQASSAAVDKASAEKPSNGGSKASSVTKEKPAKKEGLIKALAVKLEALDKAIASIQSDIEDEADRKTEAEEKLRQVEQELADLNPGDQADIKKKVQSEVETMISGGVAEKVELEKQLKEAEAGIMEREFLISELESTVKTSKKSNREVKAQVSEMEGEIKAATGEIEARKKEGVDLQTEIKDLAFNTYELIKEADELRASLMKFSKVKDSLNTCIQSKDLVAVSPEKKSSDKKLSQPPSKPSETKKPAAGAVKKPANKAAVAVTGKKPAKVVQAENAGEGDDGFWFNNDPRAGQQSEEGYCYVNYESFLR